MAKKVVINNVEFSENEILKGCFGITVSNLTGEKQDVFILSRNVMLVKDTKLRDLANNQTDFSVQYYDDNNQIFGTLSNGKFDDYKIDPSIERLQLTGTVVINSPSATV